MARTLFLIVFLSTIVVAAHGRGRHMTAQNVTYDGKSLFIDGRRELLFSGSIHYPRSTPDVSYFDHNHVTIFYFFMQREKVLWSIEHVCTWILQMWPVLLDNARRGGINVIQTYVFWNAHEPQQGQVNYLFSLYSIDSGPQNSKGCCENVFSLSICSSTLKVITT